MADKFKANIWLALPAALITTAIYMLTGPDTGAVSLPQEKEGTLVIPYLVVIGTAIAGINVTIVLSLGILATLALGALHGHTPLSLAGAAGSGIAGMGGLIIITLLAAGMLGVIKSTGGIRFLIQSLTSRVSGKRGAQTVITLLVAAVNLCTANNTVAIITVGGISRDISQRFGIDPRKTASLLDSTSCIVQCMIPYGAQTLLATSLAGISPAAPFPYLYYPWALAVMTALSIIFLFPKRLN
jgi:Na+/H+ antiporter NhaC